MNQSLVVTGGGLRVVFERRGDRFEHTVGVLHEPHDPQPTPLLASQPGAADDPWPASPPFTGVHLERHGANQIAFLVGQAGDSHWSASVELDERDGSLAFDVACRARSRPQWLGSSYRLLHPAIDEPENAALRWAAPAARVEIDAAAGAAAIVRRGEGIVAIVPVITADTTFPATIRWRYVLRLVLRPP